MVLATVLWPLLRIGVPAAVSVADDVRRGFLARDGDGCDDASEDERVRANRALLEGIAHPPGAEELGERNQPEPCIRDGLPVAGSAGDYRTIVELDRVGESSYDVLEHYRRQFEAQGSDVGCIQTSALDGKTLAYSVKILRDEDAVLIDAGDEFPSFRITLDAGPWPSERGPDGPPMWSCTPATPI